LANQVERCVGNGKTMLASNDTGYICECACGSVHLSFGPALLTFSRQEFLNIVSLGMTAIEHMRAHEEQNRLTSTAYPGRMQ